MEIDDGLMMETDAGLTMMEIDDGLVTDIDDGLNDDGLL